MSPSYLLLVASAAGIPPQLPAHLPQATGLTLAFSHPRLVAFVNSQCHCLRQGEDACILGRLFERNGPARQLLSLDPGASAAIFNSGGQSLPFSFWGGYLLAIAGKEGVRVLRDPSGALPCYYSEAHGLCAFASSAEILVAAGLVDIEIDWPGLALHFFSGGVPAARTALCGISELLCGFAVNVAAKKGRQEPCWSPWDHVHDEARAAESASDRLRRTIDHHVAASASGYGRLLLSLSGGLDSSILAASLARAGADTVCLTMYGDDPAGDERVFARALCERLHLPLIEWKYELQSIDITKALGAHLPRPSDRTQALAYEHAHLEAAAEIGAEAFATGNGGDSVFNYSQSAAPIADRFLDEGFGLDLARTLGDVCRQTGCSMFDAAASAWRLARRGRAYRCRPTPLFLAQDRLAELGASVPDHPWLHPPADALPGKAAHIASILRVQQSLEPGRAKVLAVLNPLMAQPIVEACLAVPTWNWRKGGRDRSLARTAFADVLPELVLKRRLKGSPAGFAGQILDRFRKAIRERLGDGHLVKHRIVDGAALDRMLRDEHPVSDEERVRILEFVAAEAWLDSWLARSSGFVAADCLRALQESHARP
jgi:asparagine synthase (glutamine-hydrolysing)